MNEPARCLRAAEVLVLEFGSDEAEKLALIVPVGWKVGKPDEFLGCEITRFYATEDGRCDVGGKEGKTDGAGNKPLVDLLLGRDLLVALAGSELFQPGMGSQDGFEE
jgi:hypothetical protein